MASGIKYCRKCGKQLNKDAKFCRYCGYQFQMQQEKRPVANLCPKCGNENAANAKFCRYCGNKIGYDKESVPRDGETVSSVPTRRKVVVPPKAPAWKKAPTQQKASGRGFIKRGIALVLAVSVFVVTAFYYPGFLVKEKKPENYQTAQNEKPSQTSSSKADSGKSNKTDAEAAEVMSVFDDTSGVSIGWTEEEIASAPSAESAVSPAASDAQLGKVSVRLNSWNLPGEDSLIVRELPEKTDPSSGVTAKAYDFSLASGQAEFPTYVELYIPRESQDEIGICECYNAETGKWEDVDYDVSEDGNAYIIYTSHFSLYRRLKLTEAALAKIKSNKLSAADLENEDTYNWLVSFTEDKYYGSKYISQRDYMSKPVLFVGWRGLSPEGINKDALFEAIQKLAKYSETERKDGTQSTLFGEILGYIGLASDSGGFANIIPDTTAWKSAGAILYLVGVLNTAYQIYHEMEQGRGFWDYVWNHHMDNLALAVGAVGTVAAFSAAPTAAMTGVVCGLIGIGIYGMSKMYSEVTPRELSIPERLYRDYYASPLVGQRAFFFEWESTHSVGGEGVLPKSKVMDDDDYRKLKEIVNVTCDGLKGQYCEGGGNAFGSPDYSWATTIRTLFTMYEQKPEKLREALMELYENYAKAYWKTEKEFQRAFSVQDMQNRNWENSKYQQVSEEIQNQYVDNMVQDMMASHINLYRDLAREYIAKVEAPMVEVLEKEVLPLMNAPMTFILPESAASPDIPNLRESAIYTALKDIPENKEMIEDDPDASADFNAVNSPLRFAIENPQGAYHFVEEPYFIPAYRNIRYESNYKTCKEIHELVRGNSTWYYPYDDGFLPQFEEGSNVIFRCNFYHYLMMGAPTVLVLHDPSGKMRISDIALHFELPEPAEDGSYTITIGDEGVTLYGGFNGEYATHIDGKDVVVRIGVDGYRQLIDFVVMGDDDKMTSEHDSQTFKFDPKKGILKLLPGDNMFNTLAEEVTLKYVDKNTLSLVTGNGEYVLKRISMVDDDNE